MADPAGFASDALWCGTDWGPADLVAVEFVDEPSSFADHQYTITHSTPVQPARPFTSTHKVCVTLVTVNGKWGSSVDVFYCELNDVKFILCLRRGLYGIAAQS